MKEEYIIYTGRGTLAFTSLVADPKHIFATICDINGKFHTIEIYERDLKSLYLYLKKRFENEL